MLQIHGEQPQNGVEQHDEEPGRPRGRRNLALPLQIPKNRSTGNLARTQDVSDRNRTLARFSFDASAADYDALARSPIMTDHDHGLGLSGLRRIRQQHYPSRTSTLPSAVSSRSPSLGLARSTSISTMLDSHGQIVPITPGSSSPNFIEDLSRFPSESLHSFSFAHQSEDLIHSRQNIIKRSIEFMKDRMGWPGTGNAALASAEARISGDVETQNMLDLLAKAQLVGAGNLPTVDPSLPTAPLSGPAETSGENVFDVQFVPRSTSPEPTDSATLSPTDTRELGRPELAHAKTTPSGLGEPGSGSATEALESENSTRTPTNESGTTQKTSPPASRRPSMLKRTLTDTDHVSMQQKLLDTMAQPFLAGEPSVYDSVVPNRMPQSRAPSLGAQASLGSTVHGHSQRWVPAAQAIFTTEAKPPWTILAANDLACLVFGVTRAEVRRMGILEVVQRERRSWLEKKLQQMDPDLDDGSEGDIVEPPAAPVKTSSILGSRAKGITARLLSKPNSRSQTPKAGERRAATVHSGDARAPKPGHSHHRNNKSRGVLLCGDVVPIQKRNGATGSASLWVKEKRVGLIWVLEEIHEDAAQVTVDDDGAVKQVSGGLGAIWGHERLEPGVDIGTLVPRIPRQGFDARSGPVDFAQLAKQRYYTCRCATKMSIPATVEQVRGQAELRISSFPHIAGIIVVSPDSMRIKSSNASFCGALFGHEKPDGMSINRLVPDFEELLRILADDDGIDLIDGMVIPEYRFRKASAFLGLREGRPDAANSFLRPEGLRAKHRDGSELKIDVQMRVVKSEKHDRLSEEALVETSEEDESGSAGTRQSSYGRGVTQAEIMYALWITYSRHLHATRGDPTLTSPTLSGITTPPHQPSPGQTPAHTPQDMASDSDEPEKEPFSAAGITKQLKYVALSAAAKLAGGPKPDKPAEAVRKSPQAGESARKKQIEDFVILEDMGQGAYGQVKLARSKEDDRKVVLKYVTKRRILVDTWTRDRRLGTVPLEIHVLDYLRRDGLKHANIIEMEDFFEDDVNYYIEMKPHGLPGMDLFDYIELRTTMDEQECRSIFVQVARAIRHLHVEAHVVHRDIKDENVILDGDRNIKLIDFGSAAYIKSGPFDVFVGTIDYAAPEVLGGKPYGGCQQDVWALGILLYTIIYKENPFYSIDEIIDRDLRVPYTLSDDSIDLIRCMLNRDVTQRYDINQVLEHPWCKMDE